MSDKRPGVAVLIADQNEDNCESWVAPRPSDLEVAGIDEAWSDHQGFSVSAARPTQHSTLQRLENPLSSDSAYFLRSWMRQFPMVHDQRRRRDSRDQFVARLEEIVR